MTSRSWTDHNGRYSQRYWHWHFVKVFPVSP